MKIKVKQIEGYAYGAIQPSYLLSFSNFSVGDQRLLGKLGGLLKRLPKFECQNRFLDGGVTISSASAPMIFVTILDTLNYYCGDQRFTPIRVFEEGASLNFALPTLSTAMSEVNIKAIKYLLGTTDETTVSRALFKFLEIHKRKTRAFLPAGTNAGNFIAAAAERKTPFKIFNQRYIIFGYGSSSRIFSSSITDEESAIGVSLAKSKVDTNRLLKLSGIPVAEQARVRTVDDAIRFAKRVGYPIVLKPEAEEQGRGVFANISDENELKVCFEQAASDFNNLIVEEFVKGFSYRVHLHYGQVLDAWKMVPASIVGDGHSSIEKLIDIENAKPDRNSINSSLKPIPKDYTTVLNLKKLGLAFDFCPPVGSVIFLGATSNESRGGSSQKFLSSLHPELADLCIQAARTLHLKVAAIDVLSEDAAISWRENNAVICEINSQPQMGDLETCPHIFHDLLDRLPDKYPEISLLVSNKFENIYCNAFNKSSDSITARLSPHYLLKHGSPVQYFKRIDFMDDVLLFERQEILNIISSVFPDERDQF